jgi:hypothetical protein
MIDVFSWPAPNKGHKVQILVEKLGHSLSTHTRSTSPKGAGLNVPVLHYFRRATNPPTPSCR